MYTAILNILHELAPWLLFGAFASGAAHILLPESYIHRNFNGRWGVLKAVAVGVPLPLCSCGVIPAALGLRRDGASAGASTAFLISTPQTGVDSVMVTASLLGWPFALYKVFAAIVMGVVGGYLVESGDPSRVQNVSTTHPHTHPHGSSTWKPRPLRAGIEHALDVIGSVWGWLVLGILISAAISVYLPPELFGQLTKYGAWTTGLAALLFGIPLYVCATASVPIAAALLAAGLPMGSALIFLMAGPATNVATIGAVYRGFGRRVLGIYLSTIVVGSMVLGEAFDHIFDAVPIAMHEHVHVASWWEHVSAIFMVLLIGYYAWMDGRRFLAARKSRGRVASMSFDVHGMNCENCAAKLEARLLGVPGVDFANVDFANARAKVGGDVSPSRLREEITKAGYVATPIADAV